MGGKFPFLSRLAVKILKIRFAVSIAYLLPLWGHEDLRFAVFDGDELPVLVVLGALAVVLENVDFAGCARADFGVFSEEMSAEFIFYK